MAQKIQDEKDREKSLTIGFNRTGRSNRKNSPSEPMSLGKPTPASEVVTGGVTSPTKPDPLAVTQLLMTGKTSLMNRV